MENPEEILQALDEFQKMRPSEIPRELEDYLCWVAKTGDPIYQWDLVKALFREKLMRVITEFYESCPTLDLTPCPNVEPFNYDMMKSTLLDRLENFPNAPFTVQRICELLTTPRKEYNRVDKFMRAIEKNILVVSTREPGPFGRRSENGDNLVNGSIEDETSHHSQPSNDVDMENWVKDCTATTNLEHTLNGLKDRLETTSSVNTSDYTSPHVPTQDNPSAVQNLTTTNHDAAGIIADVSDAIMNEDTSSQPSLELDSDDSNESKKLQTTFQAKDFPTEEEKTVAKTYSEVLKQGKPEESIETKEDKTEEFETLQIGEKTEPECTGNSPVSEETDSKTDELIETTTEVKCDSTDEVADESKIEETVIKETELPVEPVIKTPSEEPEIEEPTSSEEPAVEETTTDPVVEKEEKISEVEKTPEVEETPEENKDIVVEKIEPVVEKEPLPVVEEAKEVEAPPKDSENSVSVIEEAMEAKETVKNGLDESPIEEEASKMIEDVPISKVSSESMDVDNETQPDEPMEQETPEAMNS